MLAGRPARIDPSALPSPSPRSPPSFLGKPFSHSLLWAPLLQSGKGTHSLNIRGKHVPCQVGVCRGPLGVTRGTPSSACRNSISARSALTTKAQTPANPNLMPDSRREHSQRSQVDYYPIGVTQQEANEPD